MITRDWLSALLLALSIAPLATGCAHSRVPSDQQAVEPVPAATPAPQEMVGPPPPPEGPVGPEPPPGPLPEPGFVSPEEGYVLVLGPGLARGLAYVGVLREMEVRGLQIRGIVAVEMGAVIAGIWASSNLNNLEWEIHKIKRETLLDIPLLSFGGRVAEGKKLYEFLDGALKVAELREMKLPLLVASAVPNTEETLIERDGSAKDIIRGAMGIPGLLQPYSWDGKERLSAAVGEPFPVAAAKGLGLGKVVCVDSLGRGDNFKSRDASDAALSALMKSSAALARRQLQECDAVISIPCDGVGYLDFNARAELIRKGQSAARRWLEAER